jgi:hypothetical protein
MPEQSLGALRAAAPGRQGKAVAAKAKSLNGYHVGRNRSVIGPGGFRKQTTTRNGAGDADPSDVAACDVQAATSAANRIVHAGTKSWRFAGGGSGQGGKADAAKAKSLNGPRANGE